MSNGGNDNTRKRDRGVLGRGGALSRRGHGAARGEGEAGDGVDGETDVPV